MDDRNARLQEVARIAVALQAQTGCPAQLMIAQWAVESQWGAKPAGHANYFGIKMAERHKLCCTVTTREVIHGESKMMDLSFADYPSLADSCKDYVWLITQGGPYKAAWAKYRPRSAWSDCGGRRHVCHRSALRHDGVPDRLSGKRGAGYRCRAPGGKPCCLG